MMIEKVNPSHPDKIADQIAGALVDLAYKHQENPCVAIEVLIGHGQCTIIIESSYKFNNDDVINIVSRIAGKHDLNLIQVKQDIHLSNNQSSEIRCGDNGIFKGVPLSKNEKELSSIVKKLYEKYPSDGKFILTNDKLIACQSNATYDDLEKDLKGIRDTIIINPLGYWTGGTNVDTGCTNRKLGSDMAKSVTGGGLHGKDLSKADVSLNIYAFKKAQELNKEVTLCCAIGDIEVDGIKYSEIVKQARQYIKSIGGFEQFAKWGLY